ncbi:phosphate ABC transporter permease [Candidatus Uhrbacteria bacterium RIFCSPHIGHO2_12_FULL_47_12]|uniref:Transport permease protein n=1 Tax=Candidatus Uhrbacteria bacterium RIFCSPLOWO2_02_FULL_48_18 TaxID=1802408 RepID=A0A1F7V936_9BACT|nr:MAG: phosphate ABC transporter permease [Candidatus Uhrbacteria bacterium RIFCSPHIGHO2_01_FULL_47_10]OGL77200.1 MAG: phosphate ABC transporter permease [Candidatus Uhrbacteria bacterium RIFCSPHIGHO2_12_FULL_47_12]OGL81866.1 MAG: phosphate ABC transporter permease [Candidatus Uhrbacteria bacterium RIFCSPLOWO2_01_FULL_47_17]OGL87029.1 MAG: phosphate ABC transporter permease [Candidatus Uhrbacteria bacterium RIFCSPLOWO2_02_FULL_48_18]
MDILIRPTTQWWKFDWKEFWQFRDLFYFFAWRDIKVRYKQTAIGALWAVFQPFVTMVVFTIFFGNLAKISSDGIPYPIFVYVGLLFWTLFSAGLSDVSNTFIGNQNIITKVYFPRIILTFTSLTTSIIDFFVACIVLIGMMIWYHFIPSTIALIFIPFLFVITFLTTVGIGLFFSSFNVKYRDVRFILPFFIQLLLFLTPVIYPVSLVSPEWRWVLGFNPMSGVIDTARVVLLGVGHVDWLLLSISMFVSVVYCLIGYGYFKGTERYFADVI